VNRQTRADEFERCTSDLLQRLVEGDLGWTVTQNRIQARGAQHGKDIQFAWITEGREYRWHIECKSHLHGSLRKEEVMPKLFDAWRSSHQIDVWCLALAHIETGQAIDEFFAAIPQLLELPFRTSVLSPAEHNLPMLFACHEDLFRRVDPGRPRTQLSKPTRTTIIEEFGRYLLDESRRAIEPQDDRWTMVTPEAPDRLNVLADDSGAAVEYLRGFTACDWDAIAHDWAVRRPKAEQPLLDFVNDARPGVTVGWRIGPAGEGKSTSARAAAWTLAASDDVYVLWGSAEFDALELPLRWIDVLPPEKRILLFVDGTRHLEHVSQLQTRSRTYESEGRTVVCVLIDRGAAVAHSAVRRELERGRGHFHQLDMPVLDDAEISTLLGRLEERRILSIPTDEARTRLHGIGQLGGREDKGSWLLPTLMEITDPALRGFEEILEDALREVAEINRSALSLLLATSLLHAAGTGLPVPIAEDVARSSGSDYAEAVSVLRTELVRQADVKNDARVPSARLLTYNFLVSEVLVRRAWGSAELRESLRTTCGAIVHSIDTHARGDHLSKRDFDLLQGVSTYLLKKMEAFELCADWFDAWIRLDDPPTNYLGMRRLGDSLVDWMKQELRQHDKRELAEGLADKARSAFIEAIQTARQVLADEEIATAEDRRRRVEADLRRAYTSFAVLEGLVGTNFGREQSFFQAAFLSIISLGPGVANERSVANLALNLIELERWDDAAIVTAAEQELGGTPGIVRNLHARLRKQKIEVPGDGLAKLGNVINTLTTKTLLAKLGPEDWPYTAEARRDLVAASIPAIRSALPPSTAFDEMAASIRPGR
jgi:hypothetical protein